MQQRLEAAHVALILRPPSADEFGTMIHIGSEDAAAMESYTKRLFALDPFVNLREGDVVTPEELIGEKWLDGPIRSEEHTSELQSLMRISYAVFCLKKKKNNNTIYMKREKYNCMHLRDILID